jgi:hypothetical protein
MSEPEPEPTPPQNGKLLAWGVLRPGESKTVVLEKLLPDGYSPMIVNVRPGPAALRLVDVQPLAVTVANEGTAPASFMLFAASERTKRVVGAVGMLLYALKPTPPKEPNP